VRAAEARVKPGSTALTEAVARNFHKLMAYKDEYEVARLYAQPEFRKDLEARFAGDYRVHVHLAPPLLAKRDKATGHLRKQEFGPWMLKAFGTLAKFRRLRGSPLDPFGRTAERRAERALIDRYETSIQAAIGRLSEANFADVLALAGLPARIRGFGHVKEAAMRAVETEWQRLDAAIAAGPAPDDRGRAARPMEVAAE
jgi:indolepyruvate ferredoxin oxidoreductase